MSSRDNRELHTLSCRLLLDVMPGLETSVVFQENVSSSCLHSLVSYEAILVFSSVFVTCYHSCCVLSALLNKTFT